MAPRVSKKLLTYQNSSLALLVRVRRFWHEAEVIQDQFWSNVKENKTEAVSPFEQSSSSFEESANAEHNTPFMDYKEGEGILINLRLILRMRIEKHVCD